MKATWSLLWAALALSIVLTLSHALLRAASAFEPLEAPWIVRVGIGLFLYGLVFISYTFLLKHFDISVLYPSYTALSIIGVSLVGVAYFGESLSFSKILGLLFLLVGISLLTK
jgi:multidrug transporter EmrE-like cation transporter